MSGCFPNDYASHCKIFLDEEDEYNPTLDVARQIKARLRAKATRPKAEELTRTCWSNFKTELISAVTECGKDPKEQSNEGTITPSCFATSNNKQTNSISNDRFLDRNPTPVKYVGMV